MTAISNEERRRRLGHRQGLSTPFADTLVGAAALAGIHSSDPASVFLGMRARQHDFTRQHLETALYDDRSVVRVLGMRRTLFVVPVEMEILLREGCAVHFLAAQRKRLEKMLDDQLGHDPAWLEDILERTLVALEARGEATARELSEDVPELATKLSFGGNKKWAGQMGLSTRVLFLLATGGEILRGRPLGTWLSGQYRWALRRKWIPDGPEEIDLREARAELVRRWLKGYGPGTFEDVKWWTGWGVRVTRSALADAGVQEVDLDGTTGFVLAGDVEPTPAGDGWATLLPSLDSTAMGWKQRDWYLGERSDELYDRAGNIGPTIWANGRVVGGWAQKPDGALAYEVMERTTADEEALIRAEVAAVETWLDGDVVNPRFRTPLERRLRG